MRRGASRLAWGGGQTVRIRRYAGNLRPFLSRMRPSARDTSAAWRRRLTLSTRHVGRLRPHRRAAAGVRPHSARACYIAPAPMNRNPLNWRRVAASSAGGLVAVVALAAPRGLGTLSASPLLPILVLGPFP